MLSTAVFALLCVPGPASELHAPRDTQASIAVTEANADGPTVLVIGHTTADGNAGAYAARQIAGWQVSAGKLVVTWDAPLAGPGHLTEQAPWDIIREHRPDWLVELRDDYDYHRSIPASTGATVAASDSPGEALVQRILDAANTLVDDEDEQFVPMSAQLPDGSLALEARRRFGTHHLALTTTVKDDIRLPIRTRLQRVMVREFLAALDMLPDGASASAIASPAPDAINVAIYDGKGAVSSSGHAPPWIERSMAHLPDMTVNRIDGVDIAAGALDGFDAVIFGGGHAKDQAKGLGDGGRDAVREFVEAGGGYLGICAGAFLVMEKYDWGLQILDARKRDPDHTYTGSGIVKAELTERGREILGGEPGLLDTKYSGGPILWPADDDDIPDFEPLFIFRTERPKKGVPKGLMIGSPAIVAAPFGGGRVVAFSPHCERHPGPQDLFWNAIRWAAKRPRR